MYLTPTKSHWACDIEADNLLDSATRIWCVTVESVVTGEKKDFLDAKDFLEWCTPDIILVGHNFLAYDLVMLNRFWGTLLPVTRVVDTYVLSQLYNPSFSGGHSLEAWGQRLKFEKGDWNDFSQFSEEMLEYCRRDTTLTALLFRKLSNRMCNVGFTETGCEIEHLAWNIIQNKQRRHGFPFNERKAEGLYAILRDKEEELSREIYKLWPPELKCVKRLVRRRVKSGADSKLYLQHQAQYPVLKDRDDGGYDAYDFVAFNLGSPSQRIEKLLALGWQPSKFTKVTDKGGGGNPQVDEESLLRFAESSGTAEVKALAQWIVVNSRANMVRTWLDAVNPRTGAIHGKLFIASTLRYRHSNPNSANIPSVRVKEGDNGDETLYGEEGAWTYESRDLFWCGDPAKYSLVGVDAKGIQLRVLANYVNDPEFTKAILQEDPHTYNAKSWGFGEDGAARRKAKTIVYAIVMGAGDARVASEAKISLSEARATKKMLFDRVPGFRALMKRLGQEFDKTGRITLCDGTPLLVPYDYRVMPFLLQGDESRIMKKATILLDERIRREKIDARKVADIHDEWQFVVANQDIDRFLEAALGVFPETGRYFNYNLPIEGDAKVGKTWAQTH